MSNDEAKAIYQSLRNLQAIVDVLAWIAGRYDKMMDSVEKQQAVDDVLRELSDYLTGSVDRIDRILLLILDRLPERNVSPRIRQETDALKRETIRSRIKSVQTQIIQHQKNLNWAEEQGALYGPESTLDITNKIIWEREKIQELQQEIDYLKQNGE